MPDQRFLTIDIGSTWTKAFQTAIDSENFLNIEKSFRLPTAREDLLLSTETLLANFSEKELPKIFVSSLPEAEGLAKKLKAEFVREEGVSKFLVDFFKSAETNIVLFDAGSIVLQTEAEPRDVGKYLTYPVDEISLENLLGNRKYRPHILPNSPKDLEVEEAFLRNALGKILPEKSKKKLTIIATGGLVSGTPSMSRLALIVLDVLREHEVAEVFFDRDFFLPSFGTLLATYKQLQVVTPGPWLDRVGAFISLGGPLPLKLDWGYSQLQEIELSKDEIALVPASREQTINLSFLIEKEKHNFSVNGGSLGILLDSREKPLALSFGQESSRVSVSLWHQMLEKTKNEEAF
ncbi:MAG: hypothetical protein A2172_02110 [Candidatus Woykebacteria bacterium RBG_13_40_15]|uniref:Uncharacterized protein n=1 Tax=Candidatus Woykebacteria bacterium RBG_13_40_15 TaxID=1802593 RepID=A0A1G1W6A2_9BACT|nr:MAG: hypothetical protein A2172_02110 [Candidatus Woykebacteria bacterium RBG_13_40_15]